jgi:hypothetical protein
MMIASIVTVAAGLLDTHSSAEEKALLAREQAFGGP